MTYTDEKLRFLDGTQNTNNGSDVNLISYFQSVLDARYQLVLGELNNWMTEVQRTAVTKAGFQYYHNPVGVVQIEDAVITIGTIPYPLTVIQSQYNWDKLNEMKINVTSIPQFLFPRRDDFGVWPVPQDVYAITLNYDLRDRKMTQEDVNAGSVSVTTNNQTVTGTLTAFTASMIGRWFKIVQDGYWYRISDVTSPTQLTLETSFEGFAYTGASYIIGESPELPEEAHPLLYKGTVADYWAEVRGDVERATWFNNAFWTGDGQNSDRTGDNVRGGLIGLTKRYASRSDTKIIRRRPKGSSASDRLWAMKITG